MAGYAAELALERLVMNHLGLARKPWRDWRSCFGRADARAAAFRIVERAEGYHNPEFWASLLFRLVRERKNRADVTRAKKLLTCARRTREIWSTDLRYQVRAVSRGTVDELLAHALAFEKSVRKERSQ